MRGAIKATSAIPWLPTTSEQELEAPSLAEQVALMLHAERQVMVLVTGRDSGRVSGFLAELTHAVSHADTVLRIKAAIDVEALFVLLASQMHLPIQDLTPMQLAAKVGDRLRESAPQGNFVLLCEGAQNYSNALLESIRQLSNYPINIVLSGRPTLLRRLWRPALSALKQRFNYRLDLNEGKFTWSFMILMLLLFVCVALFFGRDWIPALHQSQPEVTPATATPPTSMPRQVVDAPSPIVSTPTPVSETPYNSVVISPLSPPVTAAPMPDSSLSLIMDPTLKHAPKR